MSERVTITGTQFAPLVATLDSLDAGLAPDEQDALDALVALTSDGLAAHREPEVAGSGGGVWAAKPTDQCGLNFSRATDQGSPGVRIGLLRDGFGAMPDFRFNTPRAGGGAEL